ncbi:restriction endonuclease subunit S, partial [Bacteroides fragilis]
SVEALNSFPVPMIPLRDQERIGEIFSALDKKIELNRRINQNLLTLGRSSRVEEVRRAA